MRCFLAVDVPAAVRDTLVQIQEALRPGGGDVRWVGRETLHLTLRFLGDVADPMALVPVLRQAVAEIPASELVLDRVGAFPSSGAPRVVWVGTSGDVGPVTALAVAVDRAVLGAGLAADDKPFVAHVTIGRVNEASRGLRAAADAVGVREALPVRAVTLYRSTLTPAGPIYEALAELPLGPTPGRT